jgi:hypothetical protein
VFNALSGKKEEAKMGYFQNRARCGHGLYAKGEKAIPCPVCITMDTKICRKKTALSTAEMRVKILFLCIISKISSNGTLWHEFCYEDMNTLLEPVAEDIRAVVSTVMSWQDIRE